MIKLVEFIFSFQFLFGVICSAAYLLYVNGSELKWKK